MQRTKTNRNKKKQSGQRAHKATLPAATTVKTQPAETESQNKPISAAQLAANRANAQRSAGPRSPEGKAKVAQNALRHGLTAQQIIVRDDEREEFEAMEAELLHDTKPCNGFEGELVAQILHAQWNMRRVRILETSLFDPETGLDPLADPDLDHKLDRYSRYYARFERSWYRAMRKLTELQTSSVINNSQHGNTMLPLIDQVKLRRPQKQTQKPVPSDPVAAAEQLMAEDWADIKAQLAALDPTEAQRIIEEGAKLGYHLP